MSATLDSQTSLSPCYGTRVSGEASTGTFTTAAQATNVTPRDLQQQQHNAVKAEPIQNSLPQQSAPLGPDMSEPAASNDWVWTPPDALYDSDNNDNMLPQAPASQSAVHNTSEPSSSTHIDSTSQATLASAIELTACAHIGNAASDFNGSTEECATAEDMSRSAVDVDMDVPSELDVSTDEILQPETPIMDLSCRPAGVPFVDESIWGCNATHTRGTSDAGDMGNNDIAVALNGDTTLVFEAREPLERSVEDHFALPHIQKIRVPPLVPPVLSAAMSVASCEADSCPRNRGTTDFSTAVISASSFPSRQLAHWDSGSQFLSSELATASAAEPMHTVRHTAVSRDAASRAELWAILQKHSDVLQRQGSGQASAGVKRKLSESAAPGKFAAVTETPQKRLAHLLAATTDPDDVIKVLDLHKHNPGLFA